MLLDDGCSRTKPASMESGFVLLGKHCHSAGSRSGIQLFPWLAETLGLPGERHKRCVRVLELVRIEESLPSVGVGPGDVAGRWANGPAAMRGRMGRADRLGADG